MSLLGLDGYGGRVSTFRFDLLSSGLATIGQLHPLRGPVPAVENNINRTIKRTLTDLRLPPDELADVDVFAHRVRPVMVLQDGSEHPLGVFLFADRSTPVDTAGTPGAVSLVDQTLIIDQGIPASYGVPAGRNVAAAALDAFAAAGVVDAAVDPTATALGSARTWPAGRTTWRQVLADLGDVAGFYSPYFDNAGRGRLAAVPDLETAPATIAYGAGGIAYRGSILASDDTLAAPNRYVVIETTPTPNPIVGVYEVPAGAPHSIARRGFAVTKVIERQGLPDNEAARVAARAAGQSDSSSAYLAFASAPNPIHDTFDVVAFEGVRYREQSWKLPLAEGAAMTHELRGIAT